MVSRVDTIFALPFVTRFLCIHIAPYVQYDGSMDQRARELYNISDNLELGSAGHRSAYPR